jgi:ATP-dependent DNA helicase RecQ
VGGQGSTWAGCVTTGGAALAWSPTRELVLERDQNQCRECGVTPGRAELDVHHLVPRADGGGNEPSNLVTLCDGCHAARHPHLQAGLARRTLERWGVRIARLFDREHSLPAEAIDLGPAMRLFGADRLRDGQLEPILAALRGESVLVVRATGGGKSLCFQLPSVLRPGTAFVLSPLRALMTDQVRALQKKTISSTFINADCSATEKKLRYELLEAGALKLVYLTPERFDDQMVRAEEIERLVAMRPSFLIVDEAHCIDRWGDDFRPAYSRIAEVRRRLGNPPVLAFTATAGVVMQRRIMSSLGVEDGIRHLRTRPRRPRTNGKAERFIRTMLNGWAYGAIYTTSTERTRSLAGWLDFYNHQRPHGSLSHQPPGKRLTALQAERRV